MHGDRGEGKGEGKDEMRTEVRRDERKNTYSCYRNDSDFVD